MHVLSRGGHSQCSESSLVNKTVLYRLVMANQKIQSHTRYMTFSISTQIRIYVYKQYMHISPTSLLNYLAMHLLKKHSVNRHIENLLTDGDGPIHESKPKQLNLQLDQQWNVLLYKSVLKLILLRLPKEIRFRYQNYSSVYFGIFFVLFYL